MHLFRHKTKHKKSTLGGQPLVCSSTGVKSRIMLAETKWEVAAAAGGEP